MYAPHAYDARHRCPAVIAGRRRLDELHQSEPLASGMNGMSLMFHESRADRDQDDLPSQRTDRLDIPSRSVEVELSLVRGGK
jgi:hypothetical protein